MILFENARLLSFDPPGLSEPVDLAAWEPGEGEGHGGRIAAIGKNLAERFPKAAKAGSGGYLSPGLVCAHNHLYSALSRGITARIEPSKDFVQVLQHLWWRLDRAIDLPILRASALAGGAEALLAGVTSVVDHHAGPSAIDGSLTVLKTAFEELGLRGILCYETSDRNGSQGMKAGVRENLRFAAEVDRERSASRALLVEAAIGAHAGFTLGPESMELLGEAVRSTGRGIHVHLAEDRFDPAESHSSYGKDLITRLEEAGALNDKSIIAHGLWLSQPEVDLMNERGAYLAHNARSNMNNAVGYNSLLHRHRKVVLGTDGMGSDMLEEFKFAVFRHRETQGPWWPGDFLKCLDRGNRLLESYFGGSFGKLEPGAAADLVHWDYAPPTPLEAGNIAGHLAFGLSSRSVRSVAVSGRLRIKDRKPLFDLEKIGAEARLQALRLWKNMEGIV
jgi:putative selenium metabolism protein SsnA